MDAQSIVQGYLVSAALIVAVGAQNAHVLRMGLLRRHVGLTVFLCATSDALLMGLGIAGMGALLAEWPQTVQVATWLGAAFLFAYGLRALFSAVAGQRTQAVDGATGMSRRAAILTALAFTYLNPHTYLDTLVLVGSIGGRFAESERLSFYFGCVLASTSWFVLLGFGARWLVPLFTRPFSWRVLDGCVAATMGALGVGLLRG